MISAKLYLRIICLVLCPALLCAQTPAQTSGERSPSTLRNLFNRNPGDSRTVTINTQPTNGTPTFRATFAETDRANSQIVPFSFFNVYLTGTRRMNLNLTGGIGVNPNNGANQPEFFLGGALGLNNAYVQVGGHVGRWQELGNGFLIGETVPASFPGVPIERRYTMRLGIGISYRLPLP